MRIFLCLWNFSTDPSEVVAVGWGFAIGVSATFGEGTELEVSQTTYAGQLSAVDFLVPVTQLLGLDIYPASPSRASFVVPLV
ncbi:hypothetical protein PGT21_034672 [Puccinia graminis f. sp. tritici]|uniref:Uncharacterized protein n=1 Tax=Puccinia graminis f. sp. tritici TaxID=56615 RepID=A0A5B0MPU4_PUCGR|nr:hypothetical protein PGT21_034672 [Puccinia graminis f. sp. tritici]